MGKKNRKDIEKEVLSIVSEKTGYPIDMIDIEHDMEADLGIDTVKQVELFGAVRENYNLQEEEGVNLSEYASIKDVVQFIVDKLGIPEMSEVDAGEEEGAESEAMTSEEVKKDEGEGSKSAPVQKHTVNIIETERDRDEITSYIHSSLEPIAVVGLGGIFPDSNSITEFWQNIIEGKDSIDEIPEDRWDISTFYDPDSKTSKNKSYTKIGAFVKDFEFNSIDFRIPPNIIKHIDPVQLWTLAATKEAWEDAGLHKKDVARDRVSVILANAQGGEHRDTNSSLVYLYDFIRAMEKSSVFSNMKKAERKIKVEAIEKEFMKNMPEINEDTMPGELSNIVASRVANRFDFFGPSFTCDAACASSFAAIDTAVKYLREGDADILITGGADRSMNPSTYVKFCKIGVLSKTGSRPFDAKADGFVMGEGAGILVLKRLSDAIKDLDKVYAVIRGIGASSDGKSKGITAPNPLGQKKAIERAYEKAGYDLSTVSLIEAHGTSTVVGDATELKTLADIWSGKGFQKQSVGIGSIKSQIGHLKSAAGAAGLIKMILALHHNTLAPTINYKEANPNVNLDETPFFVVTEPRKWERPRIKGELIPRRAGVSAFGFGGSNFHVTLEEFTGNYPDLTAGIESTKPTHSPEKVIDPELYLKEHSDMEGDVISISADSLDELKAQAQTLSSDLKKALKDEGEYFRLASFAYDINRILDSDKIRTFRLAVSAQKGKEMADLFLLAAENVHSTERMAMLENKGIFFSNPDILTELGHLKDGVVHPPKTGFVFPGQGSQYINMLRDVSNKFRAVEDTFIESDEIMTDIIGEPLTNIIFSDEHDSEQDVKRKQNRMTDTEITQPAMITGDIALYRLFKMYDLEPAAVAGHSLGEYGALVASEVMDFKNALLASSARGREMANIEIEDKGKMASVAAGEKEVQEILDSIDGYVIVANKNSYSESVISGASKAVEEAVEKLNKKGINTIWLPVSHAFHSEIVAPAKVPLRNFLENREFHSPSIPVLTNVDGSFYPTGRNVKGRVIDILVDQIAGAVEWVKEMEAFYNELDIRFFVEVGTKRALTTTINHIFHNRPHKAVLTNHPKKGGLRTFNEALAHLSACGVKIKWPAPDNRTVYTDLFVDAGMELKKKVQVQKRAVISPPVSQRREGNYTEEIQTVVPVDTTISAPSSMDILLDIKPKNHIAGIDETAYKDFIQTEGQELLEIINDRFRKFQASRGGELLNRIRSLGLYLGSVSISGTGIGLPGKGKRVFSTSNVDKILQGGNFIDRLSEEQMKKMCDKNIIRLLKMPDGDAKMIPIDNIDQVIKFAGLRGDFDVVEEYGVEVSIAGALDITSKLAIAAGIEALRDAGIPLVKEYYTTSTGTYLPNKWVLPEPLQEGTGVIFASAFPGYDNLIDEISRYLAHKFTSRSAIEKEGLYEDILEQINDKKIKEQLRDWISKNRIRQEDEYREEEEYKFNRKFLWRVLSMGHSQFAQFIKAKGPNTQVNAACSSTTQTFSIAEDWIRTGRAERVIIIAADDATSENMLQYVGSGFIAIGAATVKDKLEEAALPFDRRRNGLIVGMGAAGFVVERKEDILRRGMKPAVDLLGTYLSNSAYHGSSLDVEHITSELENFIRRVERANNLNRNDITKNMLFMSHETFTPARGGSADAEMDSLRRVFPDTYRNIIVTNTKGYTGHAQGAGIEDAIAIKALQHGRTPPIANLMEPDPNLGDIKLSKGGKHPFEYALRLAAGFGSQVAFNLLKLQSREGERMADEITYQNWLKEISGLEQVETEVAHNTLRIKDVGPGRIVSKRPVSKVKNLSRDDSISSEQRSQKSSIPEGEEIITAKSNDERGQITEEVMEMVAEKTGYPVDMLEPDLDMEADLGIDTVKQVELFGAIRENYNLEQEEGVNLSDYDTLDGIVEYIYSRLLKEGKIVEEAIPKGEELAVQTESGESKLHLKVERKVLEIVAEKTGYPVDMLEPDLDMEADLGIDTVKQVELFGAIRENYKLEQEEGVNLSEYGTLRSVMDYILSRLDIPIGPNEGSAGDIDATENTTGTGEDEKTDSGRSRPDEIMEKVLDMVAEMTGYPVDMLEADLDMEADLGIDTVKQVELFAAIREHYGLERDEGVNLSEFNTLRSIGDYIDSRVGDTEPASEGVGAKTLQDELTEDTEGDEVMDPEAKELRRYLTRYIPKELGKDEWFDLKKKNVIVVMDKEGIGKELMKTLAYKGANVIQFIYNRKKKEHNNDQYKADLGDIEMLGEIKEKVLKNHGDIFGILYLQSMDKENELKKIDFGEWKELNRKKIRTLFNLGKVFIADLKMGSEDSEKRKNKFLVSAVEMGGSFGIEGDGKFSTPVQGGVCGLTKALGKEMPEVLVKCIDLGKISRKKKAADLILNELLFGDERLEVCYKKGKRRIAQMYHSELDKTKKANLKINQEWVFIVPGGGFGITGEITKDIVRQFKPRIIVMDIAELPENIEELAGYDEKQLDDFKKELFQKLKKEKDRVTPVMLERKFGSYTKAITIFRNLQKMREMGSKVDYFLCDVTDQKRVNEVLDEVRKKYKRIDCIIHAAGLEISKLITQKPPEQFDLVYGVKVNGAFNLFQGTKDDKVKAYVTFSSVAGRFGNIGQTDYSSANDLLNKYMALISRERKGKAKAISLNWTGWRGVGMATRGSLLKIFDEAGVTLIPLDFGKKKVRLELLYSGDESEVTVAGNVGFLDADGIIIPNGQDIESWDMERSMKMEPENYPFVDRVLEYEKGDKVVVDKLLHTEKDRYLKDHSISGTPYLPGVMGLETFAEASSLLFPEKNIIEFKDVVFKRPVKLLRGKEVTIRTICSVSSTKKDKVELDLRIESDFINPKGVKMGEPRIHFTGKCLMDKKGPGKKKIKIPKNITTDVDPVIGNSEIYKRFFHGPAFQILGGIIETGDKMKKGEKAWGVFKEPKGDFYSDLDDFRFSFTPMLAEFGFQTCGIFDMFHRSNMSLPDGIEKVSFFSSAKDRRKIKQNIGQKGTLCRITFKGDREGDLSPYSIYDVEIMDPKGNIILKMKDYRMIKTGELEEEKRWK